MGRFFERLRATAHIIGANREADKAYVSDFTRFMDDYLVKHPEVVSDQRVGWYLYWNKNVDLAAQALAEKDSVPDDCYGFHGAAWRHGPHPH